MPRDARNVPVTVANGKALKSPPESDKLAANGNGNGHLNGNGHAALEVEVVTPTSIVKRDGRVVAVRYRADRERAHALLRQPSTASRTHRCPSWPGASSTSSPPSRTAIRRPSRACRTSSRWCSRRPASSRPPSATSSTAPSTPRSAIERPIPERGARGLRRIRPVLPDPAPEVPVLRQVLALQLRPGPPRDLDRDGRSLGRLPARAGRRRACRPRPTQRVRRAILEMRVDALHAPAGDGRRGRAAQQHRDLQLLLPAGREHRLVLSRR